MALKALIFDCDGVLVDTERDGHRVAFNRTFKKKGYAVEWSVEQYGELLKIAGGKERMRHYFEEHGWPEGVEDKDALIKQLHGMKTEIFMQIIESGELPLRPGIARIIDEAIAGKMHLAICSTSNQRAVTMVAEKMLGPVRKEKFDAILAGDVVSRKKPDPEIYHMALKQLQLSPEECVVFEDSRNGFLAAQEANIPCVVTTNRYTESDDFSGALMVVSELGDNPVRVTLTDIKERFV